ncbi:MAG: hypothetical protein KF819_07205 [Labilithrix sp.]|nr:hypothetical protein [Labilithrix sp.]
MTVGFARATFAAAVVALLASSPALARAGAPPEPESKEICVDDCWQLTTMTLRGAVGAPLSFELHGTVRANEEQKIPLFGPPSEVRLDDVSSDAGRPTITFDNDRYYLITRARSFTLRGKLTLGSDQMLSLAGPLLALDAHMTKGRLVEGEKLSGLTSAVLHFDPMSEDSASKPAAPKQPPVFRLSRSIRFGNETGFVYRLVASQSTELGIMHLPLAFGEKVQDVQGATGWKAENGDLMLPTTGKEAEITISGTLPPVKETAGPRVFKADERSAYEWWMIEADPEHRVGVAGEGKLVETSQSPIPPTMPGARVFLLQRGQQLEVDSKSLVRGDVLAAVARTNRRFVAITGPGELISDETIAFDNNGLDHLMVTPAGKAMYVSTDANAQRILHTEAGAADVLVPIRPGSHLLRVQSLADVKIRSLGGVLTVPTSSYPIATSNAEITVGLPEHVRPVAVLGGDHARWIFSRGDLVAAVLGVAVACFGFRTNRTRALGALVTAGLWFVSREGFVFASGGLFVAGAIFLASRFIRSTRLLVASGFIVVVALFSGRFALSEGAAIEPARELFALRPEIPTPEVTHAAVAPDGSLDTKAGVTPVSLSIPTSERYVQSSRQLVTRDRPFSPRILYVTSALVAALHVVWLALLGLLGWLHRDRLAALRAQLVDRIIRRPDPTAVPVADPVAPF